MYNYSMQSIYRVTAYMIKCITKFSESVPLIKITHHKSITFIVIFETLAARTKKYIFSIVKR